MTGHQWYYIKKGSVKDKTIGPVDENVFFANIFEGTIRPITMVMSASRTEGKWRRLSDVPDCMKIRQKGIEAKERKKEEARESRERERRSAHEERLQERQFERHQQELMRQEAEQEWLERQQGPATQASQGEIIRILKHIRLFTACTAVVAIIIFIFAGLAFVFQFNSYSDAQQDLQDVQKLFDALQ